MTLHLPRRQLLLGVASLLAAPAIVRAASLMPVVPVRPAIWSPRFFRMVFSAGGPWIEGSADCIAWHRVEAGSEILFGPRYNTPVVLPAVLAS